MVGNWLHLDKNRVLQEQLHLLLRHVQDAVIPASLLFILAAWGLADEGNRVTIVGWCLTAVVSRQFIGIFARRHLATSIPVEEVQGVVWKLIILQALDGLILGSLAWLAMDSASPAGNVLVIAVLVGSLASIMAQCSPVLPVFYAKAFFMLVPLITKLWQMGGPAYQSLGFIGCLYLFGIITQARASAGATRAAINLRFENLELMDKLRAEAEKALAQQQVADQARQEAEEANLARTKFLAAVSHDLRQPVHAQGLFLEVLARSNLNAEQSLLLDRIHAGSRAAAGMMNALLDYSRIEAGAVTPNAHTFRLQPLLNKIEREFAPQADAAGLSYRSRETGLHVHSDPTLVELILRNLVSNAIRYTPRGGLMVACRRQGQHAELLVYDTGIGISPDQQQEVFREFHQLGNRERNGEKGLGLGLAIAKRLASTLGQELKLDSRVRRGSVFRLSLPISASIAAETQDPIPVKEIPGQLLNARILVIDDDERVRAGMSCLLRSWGCQCHMAASLEDALAIVRAQGMDLVISDYHLQGGQNGIDGMATLRQAVGQHLPALLITGDTTPKLFAEVQERGNMPLLHKPVSPDHLFRAVVDALDRS